MFFIYSLACKRLLTPDVQKLTAKITEFRLNNDARINVKVQKWKKYLPSIP
jgi:hypothetical protein